VPVKPCHGSGDSLPASHRRGLSPCEICGERSGTGTGSSLSRPTLVFLCQYHIIPPMFNTHLHRKDKRMMTSIPWLQSALYSFMNGILICWGCSQILELFHPVKGFVTSRKWPWPKHLLTFQVSNLMSLFHNLRRTKRSVQVRGLVKCFVTWYLSMLRSR
jgi:hypothetical protein